MKSILMTILLFSVTLTSCELLAIKCDEPEPEPIDKGWCGTGDSTAANTVAVEAQYVNCGTGQWKNLWLLLPATVGQEKRWLQPYAVASHINYIPQVGDKLLVTYEPAKEDGRYNNVITCAAYPGPSAAVYIKSIKKADPQ